MKRLSIAFLGALLISISLFWLMQFMITNNQQPLKKAENLHMTEFVRLTRESSPLKQRERDIPEPPPATKQPPPSPELQTQPTAIDQAQPLDMAVPNLDIPLQSARFKSSVTAGISLGQPSPTAAGSGMGAISTDLIPLVRIKPRYPIRAQRRRISGWVKIEFTITATGTVEDPVVIASQPENIFDREALRAISRWKFKPKIIDGQAVEQRAIQTMDFKFAQ